ncbi:MAG: ornithine cyclodeaminase/mu-crystallin [Massilia sp.]|nr:ornithine cyclodeaminase/mu-crystallin [Massilia sp.]
MNYKLDATQTSILLPYPRLVDALRLAAQQLAQNVIICPERQVIPVQAGALLLSMVATAPDVAVHKLITVAPDNARHCLPTILGQVSVLDAATGVCKVVLDGATVTGRRTAALSMLGIATFLPRIPRRIALIGTGAQAQNHARAVTELYPQAELYVIGRSEASAKAFCAKVGAGAPLGSIADLPDDTDVVMTTTTSKTPIYTLPARGDRLIIAVGAFKPDAAEIDARTVLASKLYVDDPAGASHEAGDFLLAGVDWKQVTSLADALGQPPVNAGQSIIFKTVGCAAWDLAAARVATEVQEE